MLKVIISSFAVVAMLLSVVPAAAAADGKSAFVTLECNKCHTVKSQGVEQLPPEEGKKAKKSTDLSKAGKHDAAWLKGWLQKTTTKQVTKKDGTVKETKHKSKFKGSGGQLDAIVAWLAKLK